MKVLLRKMAGVILRLIPVSFIIVVYTKLCKISFLKKAINSFVLKLVPESVTLPEGILFLNKFDPIVSGSVAFGFYEQEEVAFFKANVKPGMSVVDVGANIGYFTLITAAQTGKQGRVIAFEPASENFDILRKNIIENDLSQVSCHQMALGNTNGSVELFLSEENKGDHHIYPTKKENRESFNVPLQTMDSMMEQLGITKVDIIKMDVQGAESMVVVGMPKIINQSPDLLMLVEFWPYGLRDAGTDPETFLKELSKNFEISEIHNPTKMISDFQSLLDRLPKKKYTNLICKRRRE